jgi:hypothetical protein
VASPVTAAGATSVGLSGVVDLFSRQLDLSALPVGGDTRVWTNTQWVPTRSLFAPADVATLPDAGPVAVPQMADGATAVLPDGVVGATGDVDADGSVYVAQQFDNGWTFTTPDGDGRRNLEPSGVLGWAMRFDDVNAGPAQLAWSSPLALRALILANPLLWLLALWFLLHHRPRPRPRTNRPTGTGGRDRPTQPGVRPSGTEERDRP